MSPLACKNVSQILQITQENLTSKINYRQWKDGVLPCKGQSIVIPEEVVTVPKTFIFGPETILPNNGMLLFDQSGEVYH